MSRTVSTSGSTSPYRLRRRSSRAGPLGRRVAGRLVPDVVPPVALDAFVAAGFGAEPRAVVVPREPDGRGAGRRDDGVGGRRDGTSRLCRVGRPASWTGVGAPAR
ncbi:hypothetical protein [Isoptericola variabilis]|uniref:hypothetical protein n=1 Tax=Isoptericola variabilis TaxID=139208 RepID=UPI00059C68E9|nr:hypothetical protein [Isoptericola variabilis]